MRSCLPTLLALLLHALAASWQPAAGVGLAPDPLEPAASGGLATVERALARLPHHKRLLVIAAHPDDEDTTLLALTALSLGGEAAYLSLSRGEGGQNLIGQELGEALGAVRTGELLAARRIDGARQYFARAYDFGFTRSLDETLEHWPLEVLLEDTVRVIRRFRPQAVVTIFPPDVRAGHGQHQAAGKVAELAFRRAGDPEAFPHLAAEGLAPWQPDLLFRSVWWDPEAATLEIEAGRLDPLSGRSIAQLAMASRSRHQSQSMGALQQPGSRPVRLALLESRVEGAGEGDPFAGMDTDLAAIAALLGEGQTTSKLATRLTQVARLAHGARDELVPSRLEASVPALAAILGELRAARDELTRADASSEPSVIAHVQALLAEKEELATWALAAAAGVVLDASSEEETVVPGEEIAVTLRLWNAGEREIAVQELEITSPEGWRAPLGVAAGRGRALAAGELLEASIEVPVPSDAPLTVPYYLRNPRQGSVYDLAGVPREWWGEPAAPPPLAARALLTLELSEFASVELELQREVTHREVDLATGERRRPLRVVPALEVEVTPRVLVWPVADDSPRRLEIGVRNHRRAPVSGRIELETPAGWPSSSPLPFHLEPAERSRLTLELQKPEPFLPGRYVFTARAITEDGEPFGVGLPLVDYQHLRPQPVPLQAVASLTSLDLELPVLRRLGYVRGAADQVPEALAAVGLPLELLAPEDLLERDLATFDAIVVGARAYEWQPELARANPRLLEYVEAGGRLVVQFQRWEYFEQGLAPLPMEIPRRGPGRTTDPRAPVRLLVPDHPVFTAPNRLGDGDWEGWVQERGLYYPSSWDGRLTPLLALADPGQDELLGALLVAAVGEGTYVYTGLAFFRQLPAGVAGAFRLFANLLGEGPARRGSEAAEAPLSTAPATPAAGGGPDDAALGKVVADRWRNVEERLLWWSRSLGQLLGRPR